MNLVYILLRPYINYDKQNHNNRRNRVSNSLCYIYITVTVYFITEVLLFCIF